MIWTCGSSSCFSLPLPLSRTTPSLSPSLAEKLGSAPSLWDPGRGQGNCPLVCQPSPVLDWGGRRGRLGQTVLLSLLGRPHLQQKSLNPPGSHHNLTRPDKSWEARLPSQAHPETALPPPWGAQGKGMGTALSDSTLGTAPPQVLGLYVDACWDQSGIPSP